MKINCIYRDNEVQFILNELQQVLGYEIDCEGIEAELIQGGTGFTVAKDNNRYKITYEKKVFLARAIYLLIYNQKKESFIIHQECAFEEFGLLADISRNAVLNMDTLKKLVRLIAVLGYRQLELYMEDTLEIEDEPYWGYMRGSLKQAEIKEIDDYCVKFGIELVPCIQCLAHVNQVTRYEDYQKIIDVNDILLAGAEDTYKLLEHIFRTISHSFTSHRVNIGMDEAHMLGLGKYLDQNGYHKRFDIMVEHLNKVKELCKKYNLEPEMWSDMFFRLAYGGEYYVDKETANPEVFDMIPKDIKLIYWDYYSCDFTHYDTMLKKHKKISTNIGFAGGAWKWTGFVPHNYYSQETGAPALKTCLENDVDTFILTCWGDNGAEASIFSILPSVYMCAEKAYRGDGDTGKFSILAGMSFDDYMKIDLPNIFGSDRQKHNNASKYLLYNDILIGTFDSIAFDGIGNIYKKYADELHALVSNKEYGYIFKTAELLCKVLSIKAELGIQIKDAYDEKDRVKLKKIAEDLPELISYIDEFFHEFSEQWQAENKTFGFEVQCVRFGGLKMRLQYAAERLLQYADGKICRIDELEEPRKPFHYFNTNDINSLNYNLWSDIVSPSVIG